MARMRKPRRALQHDWLNADGTKKRRARRPGSRPVGRPKKSGAGASHQRRRELKASEPVHVGLRVERAIGSLRRRAMYHALRSATYVVASREDFRIVHVSIQREHIHLLVEAAGRRALGRGMQAFQISAAKHLNAALRWETRRRGRVFSDRYHAEVIANRRQARHALAYVLNNWRKHCEDRGHSWNVDPYSTGCLFFGWKPIDGEQLTYQLPDRYKPLIVRLPKTWLLSEGWKLYGRIGFDEVPSAGISKPRTTGPSRSRRRVTMS